MIDKLRPFLSLAQRNAPLTQSDMVFQWHTLSGTHLVFKTLPLVAHCLKTLPVVALRLAKMAP